MGEGGAFLNKSSLLASLFASLQMAPPGGPPQQQQQPQQAPVQVQQAQGGSGEAQLISFD